MSAARRWCVAGALLPVPDAPDSAGGGPAELGGMSMVACELASPGTKAAVALGSGWGSQEAVRSPAASVVSGWQSAVTSSVGSPCAGGQVAVGSVAAAGQSPVAAPASGAGGSILVVSPGV